MRLRDETSTFLQLEEDEEPGGASAYTALVLALSSPMVIELMGCDDHVERGQEHVTITVRTKVGSIEDIEGLDASD